jgi:hypothetical protein
MSRFKIDRIDEYGQPYSVWESDDITEAWDQLDSLTAALDESIQPRSGQLEDIIRDLRGQIEEAEAEESDATMQAIADLVFPPAPWQRA